MYNQLKTVVKTLIPNTFLFKNELFFRYFHGLFYKGKTYTCTICDHQSRKLLETLGSSQQCPFCGSLARTRRLYHLLNTEIGLTGNVLHFSPARPLYRKIKQHKEITYHSTDFENEFLAEYRYDITQISVENDFFDRIICYHILEHIPDDHKAMRELYRVLKQGGVAIIQTPFKNGKIYENTSITTKIDRLKHFGQEDHVRIYSPEGLAGRLKNAGFEHIDIRNYSQHNDLDILHGFEEGETIIIAQK